MPITHEEVIDIVKYVRDNISKENWVKATGDDTKACVGIQLINRERSVYPLDTSHEKAYRHVDDFYRSHHTQYPHLVGFNDAPYTTLDDIKKLLDEVIEAG
jgi:hypothetical protein